MTSFSVVLRVACPGLPDRVVTLNPIQATLIEDAIQVALESIAIKAIVITQTSGAHHLNTRFTVGFNIFMPGFVGFAVSIPNIASTTALDALLQARAMIITEVTSAQTT